MSSPLKDLVFQTLPNNPDVTDLQIEEIDNAHESLCRAFIEDDPKQVIHHTKSLFTAATRSFLTATGEVLGDRATCATAVSRARVALLDLVISGLDPSPFDHILNIITDLENPPPPRYTGATFPPAFDFVLYSTVSWVRWVLDHGFGTAVFPPNVADLESGDRLDDETLALILADIRSRDHNPQTQRRYGLAVGRYVNRHPEHHAAFDMQPIMVDHGLSDAYCEGLVYGALLNTREQIDLRSDADTEDNAADAALVCIDSVVSVLAWHPEAASIAGTLAQSVDNATITAPRESIAAAHAAMHELRHLLPKHVDCRWGSVMKPFTRALDQQTHAP